MTGGIFTMVTIMICSSILSFDGFLGYVQTFWFTKVTICIVYIAAWLIFIILAKSRQNLYFALTCGVLSLLAFLPNFNFSLFLALLKLIFVVPFSALSKYITNPFIAPVVCIIWITICLIKLRRLK